MFDCQRIRGFSRILSLSLCALVTVQPALAFGGEGGNCFERAADKINPGSRIDLVTTTGDRLSGRLALIDFRERVLRMLGGGLAGYLIGSIVPSVTTSSHTIVCEPVIAREGP